MVASNHALLETRYALQIIKLLHDQKQPLTTRYIVEAVGASNWASVSKALNKLQESGLVIMRTEYVGRKRSMAHVWAIEPEFGAKVAERLEEVERWMDRAKVQHHEGRHGITAIETEEEIVSLIRRAVNIAK